MLEGETATLVCGTDLTGNPLPNITWTDNSNRSIYLFNFFNPHCESFAF